MKHEIPVTNRHEAWTDLVQLDGHLLHLGLQLVRVGLLQAAAGNGGAAVPAGDSIGHFLPGPKQPEDGDK